MEETRREGRRDRKGDKGVWMSKIREGRLEEGKARGRCPTSCSSYVGYPPRYVGMTSVCCHSRAAASSDFSVMYRIRCWYTHCLSVSSGNVSKRECVMCENSTETTWLDLHAENPLYLTGAIRSVYFDAGWCVNRSDSAISRSLPISRTQSSFNGEQEDEVRRCVRWLAGN